MNCKPPKQLPPDIKEEYPAMRAEILQWQNYRFLTLTVTGAVIAAFFTIMAKDSSNGTNATAEFTDFSKFLALLGLLSFLACAMAITLYAGRGNQKLGTYLEVFYEERETVKKVAGDGDRGIGWEGRFQDFSSKVKSPQTLELNRRHRWLEKGLTLNRLLGVFYFILGVGSVLLLYYFLKIPLFPHFQVPYVQWLNVALLLVCILLIPVLLMAVTLLIFLFIPPPRTAYRDIWRAIRNGENEKIRKRRQLVNFISPL